MVVGDIVDPYFAEITRGVEDVAARAGFMTIVCNADRRTEAEIEQLAVLSDYRAEGVVFAGSGYVKDPGRAELADAVSGRASGEWSRRGRPAGLRRPRIHADNRAAAHDMTEYLISLGHRGVAFIGGPPALYASRDRSRAFGTRWRPPASNRSACTRATSPTTAAYAATLQMWPTGAARRRDRRQRRHRRRRAGGASSGTDRGARSACRWLG